MAGLGSQHIVELLAHNFTLIMTVFSILAGSLAAGLAGFAFSAISGAILFHGLPSRTRWIAQRRSIFPGSAFFASSMDAYLWCLPAVVVGTRLWH